MGRLLIVVLLLTGASFAGTPPPLMNRPVTVESDYRSSLEDLKMQRRFGIGASVAGPLSIMGIEADINVDPNWSISGGIGTGLDYSTIMVKSRHYLLGRTISPYLGWGFARWWTKGTNENNIGPAVLKNEFLAGQSDYTKGFDVWIFYPTLGAQYLHKSGFSVFVEAHYLFRMFTLAHGVYAGAGVHWYF